MPRPQLIRSEIHPYHVTARSNNKEFFPIPLSDVWKVMLEELDHVTTKYSLCVHAFVLMGNHFHLLCHTPKGNLDEIMQSFMRRTSVRIKARSGEINHLWGGPYNWSIIRSQRHYFQVYRYIYQNPLRAGIVDRVEKYPFSTIKDVPLLIYSFVPMSFGGREGELVWLNERYRDDEKELIQKGLSRGEFAINKKKINTFLKLSVPGSLKVQVT